MPKLATDSTRKMSDKHRHELWSGHQKKRQSIKPSRRPRTQAPAGRPSLSGRLTQCRTGHHPGRRGRSMSGLSGSTCVPQECSNGDEPHVCIHVPVDCQGVTCLTNPRHAATALLTRSRHRRPRLYPHSPSPWCRETGGRTPAEGGQPWGSLR